MKTFFTLFTFLSLFLIENLFSQAPNIQWEKSLGGSGDDEAFSIQQTTDNGFIVAGYSNSVDGDVTESNGVYDYWVLKLDEGGNITWQKTFGGSSNDFPYSVQQTTDSGFIVAGHAASPDGDVSGNHGSFDYWIAKLSASGDLQWQKSLGGSDAENAFTIQQISNGDFIVVGSSRSTDGDLTINHGLEDYWIVKLAANGNLIWQKSLGGSDNDRASSVQQTSDGGFVTVGYTWSNDGDVGLTHGQFDEWIVKLDSNGNFVWQKALGGTGGDEAKCIKQISGGGFIIAGYSGSNDGDVSNNHGDVDVWLLKLDANGNLVWQKCLGGTADDRANSVHLTTNGDFIISGYSYSNDGDVLENHGDADYWIMKVDADGNLLWEKSLGGSGTDAAYSAQQTSDGGFIVAGYSNSVNDDVSGNHGSSDFWIVKLSSDSATGISSLPSISISAFPNPSQSQLTVTLPQSFNEVTIRVHDLHGRIIVLETTYTNTQAQLNTATLPNGFYTLEIINNKTGENYMERFLKIN
ncbi:MAG: T9SS type A sorting domain-containing protein [Chitinophagales bacterium]|nr:T9SS type A sorting domain-containing protein [Chitinophagales bacterium]